MNSQAPRFSLSRQSIMNQTDNTIVGDSFDAYGRYVASELRSLNSRYAQECTKLKIQQALFEGHFTKEQSSNHTSAGAAVDNTEYSVALPTMATLSSPRQQSTVLLSDANNSH